MHRRDAKWDYNFWILPEPPQGAGLWLFKAVHFISNGRFSNVQMPSGITVRLICAGRGRVGVGRGAWPVEAGDMFCALPGVLLRMEDEPQAPWEWYEIQLTGAQALDYLASLGLTRDLPVRRVACLQKTQAAFRAVLEYFKKEGRNPYVLLALAYELVACCGMGWVEAVGGGGRGMLLRRAQALIETRLEVELNVNEIARLLGVERTTLLRAFRQELGTTPVRYLQEVRLSRAKDLLANTNLPVTQIGLHTGFRSDKYFFACFKRATGLSPSVWRGQLRHRQ